MVLLILPKKLKNYPLPKPLTTVAPGPEMNIYSLVENHQFFTGIWDLVNIYNKNYINESS